MEDNVESRGMAIGIIQEREGEDQEEIREDHIINKLI